MQTSTKAILAFIVILAAATGLIAATPLLVTSSAHASGLNNEKNFGQCKKDFPNGQGCVSTVKPGNG